MRKFFKTFRSLTFWGKTSETSNSSHHSVLFQDRRKDLVRLMSEISREMRMLSGASRQTGVYLLRERHEELGRLLSELQRRMRLLDEVNRRKYEPKAEGIMADAAKMGITLPPT